MYAINVFSISIASLFVSSTTTTATTVWIVFLCLRYTRFLSHLLFAGMGKCVWAGIHDMENRLPLNIQFRCALFLVFDCNTISSMLTIPPTHRMTIPVNKRTHTHYSVFCLPKFLYPFTKCRLMHKFIPRTISIFVPYTPYIWINVPWRTGSTATEFMCAHCTGNELHSYVVLSHPKSNLQYCVREEATPETK